MSINISGLSEAAKMVPRNTGLQSAIRVVRGIIAGPWF